MQIRKAQVLEGTNLDGTKWKVRLSDPMLDRVYEDTQRAIGMLSREFIETEFMLSPPKGHPPERIYRQALRDRETNPQLSVRDLAEKYLPIYFPEHAEHGIKAMEQGLRRARRRVANRSK